MYLEWYQLVSLIIAIPGAIALFYGLGYTIPVSLELFKAIGKNEHMDGLSAAASLFSLFANIVILLVYSIPFFVFGPISLLYATAILGLVAMLIIRPILFG